MGTAMDITQALAYLQVHSPQDGTSMYDHLTNLVSKILEEKPANAVDLLEASLLAKKSTFDAKESSPLVPIPVVPDATLTVAAASLFGDPELPINPRTGEPVAAEPPNEFECENMTGAGVIMDSLGVGLGREVMLNVGLAVKRLGEDPALGLKSVRFFGKLMGLYADYYVFEVTEKKSEPPPPKPAEDAPKPPNPPANPDKSFEVPVEVSGTGANRYIYLVCNSLGGPLTRLPDVTPAQIKASRRIKKLLTGRLTSHVSTYPVFPGNEANYLRALIARIGAATVVAPAGRYAVNDETGQLEAAEDWEPTPGQEMASPANWVHVRPHLKAQGRCDVYKRELPEEADEEEFYNEDELEDEKDLMMTLEEDAEFKEEQPAWTPVLSSSSEAVKTQAGGLRSLVWPGAVCGARGGDWTCCYVGWGVKNAVFVPVPPPPVTAEFDQTQVETQELALKPAPPPPEEEEGAEDE